MALVDGRAIVHEDHRAMEKGRLEILRIESNVLKGNPLGDPHVRRIWVYTPVGFDPKASKIPALLMLSGFTGNGASYFNDSPFWESLDQRLDRLISEKKCPPCLIVSPDCFTRLGGSQYINSSAVGRYEDFIIEEVIPFLNQRYAPKAWGIAGKSSGGFAAMTLGMRHPDVFKVIGNHSGDSNFELNYLREFGKTLDEFRKAGGPQKWLESFWDPKRPQNRKDIDTLDILAMAACYSPNPESSHLGIDFPFDLETGVFRPEVWERWRAWDPVHQIARYKENLKKIRFIYMDCGTRDEYFLHWGCRAIVAELKKIGIEPHYEEFDDGHMGVGYRNEVSLPLLVKALSA